MKNSVIIQLIDGLVRPAIEGLGFSLVRIKLSSQRGEDVLQIMAEPADGEREMTVEDCAQISRHVSAIMDVEDPITSAYRLEISSPGIDRPLTSIEEFERFIGHTVNVEMEWPVDGRKRFKGDILSAEAGVIVLQLDAKNKVSLEFEGMQSAKLALTDDLIKQYLSKRKEQAS